MKIVDIRLSSCAVTSHGGMSSSVLTDDLHEKVNAYMMRKAAVRPEKKYLLNLVIVLGVSMKFCLLWQK